jgi:hypothetical protein
MEEVRLIRHYVSSSPLRIRAPLLGFHVDQPLTGVGEGDFIVVGWALLEDGPPAQIEIVADGKRVAHVRPEQARPDVGRVHPNVPGADASGFRVRLPGRGAGELVVQVVLDSGERIPIWLLKISDAARADAEQKRRGLLPMQSNAADRDQPEVPDDAIVPGDVNFRVVAIISTFNEADIIDPVLAHLYENRIEAYLIDNHSTDDTVERARAWLGKGLLDIETFPSQQPTGVPVAWAQILERKAELAAELGADWYIHHDADEIRESPWPGMSLHDALRWVDRLGFNTIEFRLLNFPPVDDGFAAGCDLKTYFTRWEEGPEHDRIQRKCWKAGQVDLLLADGGHDVRFENRRLFPIPFLLRHYPIRSQRHGTRKVMKERKGRFAPTEIALGWHRQYDHVDEGFNFLRNPASLQSFDLEQVRLETLVHGAGTVPENNADEEAAPLNYEGVLDRVDSKRIVGWARATNQEDEPVTVELWDGGRKFETVTAEAMRGDLKASGKGGGRAGFIVKTPEELLDGRHHWIWANVAGTAIALHGSPMVLGAVADGFAQRAAAPPSAGEVGAPSVSRSVE